MLFFRLKSPALPELLLVELRRLGPPDVNLTSSSSSSSSRRRFSDNRSGGVLGDGEGDVAADSEEAFPCWFWACAGSVCVSMASSSSSSG